MSIKTSHMSAETKTIKKNPIIKMLSKIIIQYYDD